MKLSLALVAALAVGVRATMSVNINMEDLDLEALLTDLWDQTDHNGDGVLNVTEFTSAAHKLGITVCTDPAGWVAPNADEPHKCTLYEHTNITTLFTDLDTDQSGGLTEAELAAAISTYPDYQQPLIAAFSNGAGTVPSDVSELMPSDEMTAAEATVAVTVVVQGSPASIYPGQRFDIQQSFADMAGVSVDMVIIVFSEVTARRHLVSEARRRKLGPRRTRRLQAVSTSIDATIFVADEAAATAASNNFPTDAAGYDANPAFADMTVEVVVVPVATVRVPPLPSAEITICAVVMLVVLPIVLTVLAIVWAGKNTANLPAEPSGCCDNGCCSFNAVGPWALGQLIAGVAMLAFMFTLYGEMFPVADAIVGMVTAFNEMANSDIEMIKDYTEQIPQEVIKALRENVYLFEQIPTIVIIPGIFAGFFLLVSSICPVLPMNKGSYCVTKTMIFLAWWCMGVAFADYVIWASFAAFLTYAPPSVQDTINEMRASCVTIPATATQMLQDNTDALNQLAAAGQDVSELQETVDELNVMIVNVNAGCENMEKFFLETFRVYLPAMLATIACVYAYFSNNQLCCVTGCCCKGPPTEAPAGKAAPTMTGVGEAKPMEVEIKP